MATSPRRYTQQEIDDLIACPKVVSEAPKREMKLDRGHFRNDMRLKSTELEFRVFMRRSEDLPEKFLHRFGVPAEGRVWRSGFAPLQRTARRIQRLVRPRPSALELPRPPRQRGDDRSRSAAEKGGDDQQRFCFL
jgi:hypothetical protein